MAFGENKDRPTWSSRPYPGGSYGYLILRHYPKYSQVDINCVIANYSRKKQKQILCIQLMCLIRHEKMEPGCVIHTLQPTLVRANR